jgi:hypothetical protein
MTATRITRPAWGSFYDTTTQNTSGANQANTITLNTSESTNSGVSVTNSSRITFAYAGTYDVQFSAQLDMTSGGGTNTTDIWLAYNGNNVANSNTVVTVSGSAGAAKSVAAWNWLVTVSAGDYVQIKWSSPDSHMALLAVDAAASPTRPAVPSVIVTAVKVDP